jgi:membrane protease YdiL (CAAX protease family)
MSQRSRLLQLGRILRELLQVGAVYIIAQVIGVIVITGLGERDLSTRLVVVYICSGAALSLATYWLMRLKGMQLSDIALVKPSIGTFTTAAWLLAVYVLMTTVAGMVLSVIPGIDADQPQDLGLNDISGAILLPAFFALVVVAPFAEELLFRGYLLRRLEHLQLKSAVSAAIVCAIFGLVHGQVNVAVDTMILSVVMVYGVRRTGSLWTAIWIHAAKNCVAFTMLFAIR